MPIVTVVYLCVVIIALLGTLFFLLEACSTLFKEVQKLRHRINELERSRK